MTKFVPLRTEYIAFLPAGSANAPLTTGVSVENASGSRAAAVRSTYCPSASSEPSPESVIFTVPPVIFSVPIEAGVTAPVTMLAPVMSSVPAERETVPTSAQPVRESVPAPCLMRA